MPATLTRGTAGLIRYDTFGTDTSASYTGTATVSVSGGVISLNSAGFLVYGATAGVKCMTAKAQASAEVGCGGVIICANTAMNPSPANRDYYRLDYGAGNWLLRQYIDNSATTLATIATPDPSVNDWCVSRIYISAGTVYGRTGTTALNVGGSGADATYASGYGGLVLGGGGVTPNRNGDNFHACTSHIVTVTTLPAGSSVVCSDGTTTASADTAAGTATVDCGAILFPLATITAYDSTGGGGNVLVQLTTATYADMCGGDSYAYDAGVGGTKYVLVVKS